MKIQELKSSEIESALALAWKVFLKFEAPDYSKEGVEEFRKSIYDPQYLRKLRFYGAFKEEDMVGVIATRSSGNHIALFFVEGKHQRQGIGRKLFAIVCKDNVTGKITVNSSPFAIPVYHHLGFVDTDTEQVTNGLRYTPMVYEQK